MKYVNGLSIGLYMVGLITSARENNCPSKNSKRMSVKKKEWWQTNRCPSEEITIWFVEQIKELVTYYYINNSDEQRNQNYSWSFWDK